jgi:hypothetical protein
VIHLFYIERLKDNLHVAGSFTVGILKLAKSGWLSGLNNVKVRVLYLVPTQSSTHFQVFSLDAGNPHYGDSFLFTEQEVKEFLQKTDVSTSPFRYATRFK